MKILGLLSVDLVNSLDIVSTIKAIISWTYNKLIKVFYAPI